LLSLSLYHLVSTSRRAGYFVCFSFNTRSFIPLHYLLRFVGLRKEGTRSDVVTRNIQQRNPHSAPEDQSPCDERLTWLNFERVVWKLCAQHTFVQPSAIIRKCEEAQRVAHVYATVPSALSATMLKLTLYSTVFLSSVTHGDQHRRRGASEADYVR
jgi:hypothetical protein